MNSLRWAFLFALLFGSLFTLCSSGCAGTLRPVTLLPAQTAALETTAEAWKEAGLPSCPRVLLADVRYVRYPCGASPELVVSCLGQEGNRPIIFVRDSHPRDDMTALQHEGCHLCQASTLRLIDPAHLDARVWSAAGKDKATRDASVQRRAWVKIGIPAPAN